MPRKALAIGVIVEIPTSKGLAYAQVSHQKERWGELLRVLPGLFSSRPEDLASLTQQRERFVVFFPLQAALRRKIFHVVGSAEVPDHAKPFPTFRMPGIIDREGRMHGGWLWDGEREWYAGPLSDEQRGLPVAELWNDTLLIERIEEGWTPKVPREGG